MKHIVRVCLHGWKKGIINGWAKPIGLAVVCGALGLALCSSAPAAQPSTPITQVEFLQMLVLATGDNLGSGATAADYTAWAARRGYNPNGGWQAGSALTKTTLAQTLVQVLGLNPRKQGGDYVRILEREGISLPNESVLTRQGIMSVLGDPTMLTRMCGPISPHRPHGNNGVGNGEDPPPPGWDNPRNPHYGQPQNDGPGTGPGNPGNRGGKKS